MYNIHTPEQYKMKFMVCFTATSRYSVGHLYAIACQVVLTLFFLGLPSVLISSFNYMYLIQLSLIKFQIYVFIIPAKVCRLVYRFMYENVYNSEILP